MLSTYEKTQIERTIKLLEYVEKTSDIYGCEIKLKCSRSETDWLTINEDQVKELIQTYKNRLK